MKTKVSLRYFVSYCSYHGKKIHDGRLYTGCKRKEEELERFKDVWKETWIRGACPLVKTTDNWLRNVWKAEYEKELPLMEEFLGIPDMYSKAVKLEKGFNE